MDKNQHLDILRQAVAGTLPANVDSESAVSVLAVKDLIDSGHLEATDTSSLDGDAFLDPRITTSGREYLRVLEERAHAASISGKVGKQFPAVVKWVFGIIAALLGAYLIKQVVG
jgi:hypothetical protein